MAKYFFELDTQKVIESLSDYMHKVWANWADYQMNNSSDDNVKRWKAQIKIDYKDLSEIDKEKDRKFAREILSIIQKELYK